VRVVIVYVFRSNKGHPPIAKTCFLAPISLLSLTLTLNTYKLTSEWYLFLLALRFRNLPFSTALNHRMTRLAVIFIIRGVVIAVASLTARVTF